MMTYGDGVASVNIAELVAFHRSHGCLATVTSTQPSGRFGALCLGDREQVTSFQEKPVGDGNWINGGFFVLETQTLDYISNDATLFEKQPMEELVNAGQLVAYKHSGFWQPMDTLRDKIHLEELWASGNAPWKLW
jgi:glucose-1-phosphate cytidylyltransferase